MPDFIQGLELAGSFYLEAVRPLLQSNLPGLQYSAALLGSGSEVLGFDTEMSTDHHWGPALRRDHRRETARGTTNKVPRVLDKLQPTRSTGQQHTATA